MADRVGQRRICSPDVGSRSLDTHVFLPEEHDGVYFGKDDFAAAPCARPGVLDPCFNAGLLVFRPDANYYREIMNLWQEITRIDTCPNDQVLLWHYYADTGNWKALPYAYNIRRIIFRPLNSFHFACCRPPKPWSTECRPSRREARDFDGPILIPDDMVLIFWKNYYEVLKKHDLENWWRSTEFFRPAQEFGVVSYADCCKELWKPK